ncbi:Ribonuclease/ribotoxin [Pseudomassariella vexata]|uniref:Ribonuclease/ribotoxin n=1 Tax=Pseudomassariella vexata TaxID=1141098 RepID=A0A1Y2DQ94_9PEZI|nr:Ribonuclease/ribotoxin [Pseudomassariella vexata]ORY61461.1 Ribonuclease/ribotoxin [Pseudomassariella vexata]
MLFNMKSVILYGLMAIAQSSPLPVSDNKEGDLSKRAKLGDFLCPDGTTVLEADVRQAFHECRRLNDGSIGKYPEFFGNKNGNVKVFTNIPDNTDLREFPIIKGGVYTGDGSPGAYRVVTDYKDNKGDFRGVMQHTGPTVGGAYQACTLVTNTKRDDGDKNRDKENKDKDKSNKHKDASNSVRTTSPVSVPNQDVNDLAIRSKKKKVGSAICNGVELSKDDVANAFAECKKHDDNAVGGSYPHYFGNQSNGPVFSVTKDLREYPIIRGGTWTGNGAPGPYRVVTDYKNNFVGVMIEGGGAAFQKCTVNSD